MKSVITTLSLVLFAHVAQAAPGVNDLAFFQGNWGPETITQELVFTAFNPGTRQFTKVTTTTVGAKTPATATELVDHSRTASDAAMDDLVRNCVARGGVSETLAVPAGTFSTCRMADGNGGLVWFGNVPFAVVQWNTTTQNKPLLLRLMRFTRGTSIP